MQVVGRMPVETGFEDDAIPEKYLPNSIDAVTEQATRQNPAVLAAQSDENAARAGVGVAVGALLPTVNLVGSYGIQHQTQSCAAWLSHANRQKFTDHDSAYHADL